MCIYIFADSLFSFCQSLIIVSHSSLLKSVRTFLYSIGTHLGKLMWLLQLWNCFIFTIV